NVDGTEALDSGLERVLDRSLVGHIGGDSYGFALDRWDFGDQRCQPLRSPRGEHHFRALFGERYGACFADPGAGAGHHHDAPLQYAHLDPLRMLSAEDRKSTRLNSSHVKISYAVFCLKKKKKTLLNQPL